jgi:hypothetical protein
VISQSVRSAAATVGKSVSSYRNRCILILDGFVDDSGAGHGKVTVLAGFLSTAERWKQFSDELEDLCQQDPKTPDFRMVKATNFRAYWPATRQQLDKRIEDVAALVQRHAAYRVDAVVSREAYDDIVKGKVPKAIDNPYFLLFYVVILSTAAFMDRMKLDGKWILCSMSKGRSEETSDDYVAAHQQFLHS